MSIVHDFKTIFKRITPVQVVANELAEAEFSLLKAESGVEYATALVTYNKARIKRLKMYMSTLSKERTK